MGLEKKWKLLLRELARHLQKHRIEQGGDVFVLLDNSRTDGPSFPKYGFRIVYGKPFSSNLSLGEWLRVSLSLEKGDFELLSLCQ